HSSPLALFFDKENVLSEDFKGDGFVIRYAGGGRAGRVNPLRAQGKDLLHLKLSYNKLLDNYIVQTTRIVDGFNSPTDAVLVGNTAYVIEYTANTNGRIWKITLPKD